MVLLSVVAQADADMAGGEPGKAEGAGREREKQHKDRAKQMEGDDILHSRPGVEAQISQEFQRHIFVCLKNVSV